MDSKGVNHTGDATLLRKVNETAVLELIREQGPITRSEVARRLHLSPPTITRIVSGLLENNLVRERNSADSRGGRPPTLLEFNFRANLIIGVYVGQKMIGALADLNGQVIERLSVPSLPGEAGLQSLISLIDELRQRAVTLGIPVRGIGIGAPSIVNFPEGIVAWAPILGWRNLPLKQRLEAELGLPVFVENEVNLIALGESWRGAGRGIRDLICISLGAGIGAGLILGGQLYRGSHNAAGEVGYVIPNERYLGQLYDTYGCLESLAGSNGIVQRARGRLAAGEPSILAGHGSDGLLTVEAVLTAARAGDRLACAVLAETVDYLSIAIANLACIVDPERIVLSGELAEYGDLFLAPIQARIQGATPVTPEIVLSDLRIDAAVLGAVAIVMRETSGALFVQPSRA